MSNEKNEKIDTSNVYEMFEELKELQEKQLMAIEELCSKLVSTPESAPAITPEDGKRIEMLAEKLDGMSEKLSRPLKHRHTLDFMGNRALIALATAVVALFVSLWITHNQRGTIARNRDNDLKYRYVRMHGEATPGDIEVLETIFTYDRDPDSIKIIRRQVVQYERLTKERAERIEQARFNASEAERLRNEVETVRERK